jgi:hypothetical protein
MSTVDPSTSSNLKYLNSPLNRRVAAALGMLWQELEMVDAEILESIAKSLVKNSKE